MSRKLQTNGMGLPGWLTVLFVALKLIPYQGHHIIDWSWWWVFVPVWGAFALLLALGIVAFVIAAITTLTKGK